MTTYLSGLVDETDLAFENGYPGPLATVLGIWVEEIDALYEDQTNRIVHARRQRRFIRAADLADLLHAETAEVLATYGSDFYQGMPVVTRNRFGAGSAYYLASDAEDAFLDHLYGEIAEKHNLKPALAVPEGVEVAVRHKAGKAITFVLNHTSEPVTIDLEKTRYHNFLIGENIEGELTLAGCDVAILTEA